MKHSLLTFILALTTLPAFCQIIINQSDMPATADTLRVSMGTLPGIFNPALTGPNYTWNFSNLIPVQQRVEKSVAVSSTPAFYQLVFNLPFGNNKATIAYKEPEFTVPGGTGGTIPAITDYYSFFKNSAADFRKIGFGVTLNGAPVPVSYNSPEVIYKFPLAINNRDSSNFSFVLNIPNTLYYGQTGKRVNKADGWGTLTTPFGIFQTLRVVSKITAKDTISQDTSFSIAFDRPLTREYKWLAKTHKIPVLTITTTELNGIETVASVIYRDIYRNLPGFTLGTPESVPEQNIGVYPNPFREQISIEFVKSGEEPTIVELTDALGKIICRKEITGNLGAGINKKIGLNTLNLQNGIYFLRLQNGDLSIMKKLTKTD